MQKRGPGGRDVWEARDTKKGQETCQSFGYWGTACMIQERVWVGRSLSKVPCLASDAQMTELVCAESEDGRFRRTREMPSVRVWGKRLRWHVEKEVRYVHGDYVCRKKR